MSNNNIETGGKAVLTLLIVMIVLAMTAVVGGAVFDAVDTTTIEERETSQLLPQSDQLYEFQTVGYLSGEVLNITQVRDTTGYALYFDGSANSYVSIDDDEDLDLLGDDDWTVTSAV